MQGGKFIILIGATGQGKSPQIRAIIGQEKPCFVFDFRNEYGDVGKYGKKGLGLPTDISKPRCRYLGVKTDEFISIAKKKRNCNIVFEEASLFFKGKTPANIAELATGKIFHGNNYIFVFHQIRIVPPELLGYADWVILFKTGDSFGIVKTKDHRLVQPYIKLLHMPDGSHINIKWLG